MISKKDVQQVASLSRIYLNKKEIEAITKNLEDILHYIAKLEKLDVTNIKPTSHVLPIKNVYREDQIMPSLPQNDALSFSVEKHNGSFKVPKVIE